MTSLILASLILGISYCAPPGVVTAEAIRRGLAKGFWPALWVELGSLIGDIFWAIMALLGVVIIVQRSDLRLFVGSLGVGLLFYLAISAFKDARQGELPKGKNGRYKNAFVTGAILSLSNPFAIAFWLGVGGTVVATYIIEPQLIHYVVFLSFFTLGALGWSLGIASAIAWGQKYMTSLFFQIVNVICGICLVYFGVRMLWQILGE